MCNYIVTVNENEFGASVPRVQIIQFFEILSDQKTSQKIQNKENMSYLQKI